MGIWVDFNKAPPGATHYSVSDSFIGTGGYWVRETGENSAEVMNIERGTVWKNRSKGNIWFHAKPIPKISLENK